MHSQNSADHTTLFARLDAIVDSFRSTQYPVDANAGGTAIVRWLQESSYETNAKQPIRLYRDYAADNQAQANEKVERLTTAIRCTRSRHDALAAEIRATPSWRVAKSTRLRRNMTANTNIIACIARNRQMAVKEYARWRDRQLCATEAFVHFL